MNQVKMLRVKTGPLIKLHSSYALQCYYKKQLKISIHIEYVTKLNHYHTLDTKYVYGNGIYIESFPYFTSVVIN